MDGDTGCNAILPDHGSHGGRQQLRGPDALNRLVTEHL